RGWSQMSDDHVILDFSTTEPTVRSLPFESRLRPRSMDHFADDATRGDRKRLGVDSAPLKALFIVEQVSVLNGWVELKRIAPASAFPEILPHAHAFDPHDAGESNRLVQHYLTLVERVPAYTLKYRPDFSRLDDLVDLVELYARNGRSGSSQSPATISHRS